MADKEVRKLAAVMFTDIQGYTAFVQQDEASALKKVAIHRQFLEKYTAEFNGKVVAFYGDGSLSIYESALDAVQCGIAMQKAYQDEHPIPVRIGIHVGDIVFKDETVFGDGVNISSRIQASGIPGSIYISDRVRAELSNHPEIKTKSVGRKKLKNVSTPIEIFAITNQGLKVPTGMSRVPEVKQYYKYIPILLAFGAGWWFFNRPYSGNLFGEQFTKESISVPELKNLTGDDAIDHVAQMASHWITKELSSTPEANVVSYETANEMIQLAGLSLTSKKGRKQYSSLTGAVNIVDASYTRIGKKMDSLMMSGWISSLETGLVIETLDDAKCSAENPMECIQAFASCIKGYWASRKDKVLTPPNYEAYKAFMAAKAAWRGENKEFQREQLDKAIRLDPGFIDPYFLLLDYFYNEGLAQDAYDTIQVLRKKFSEMDAREKYMLNYHTADVNGKNDEAYNYFLNEYAFDPKNLFINTSAMVMAIMYRHNPNEAIRFFRDIPFDSLKIEDCPYCLSRVELAMWAAFEADSLALADALAPQIAKNLVDRKAYGHVLMYYIAKKDTTSIDQLIADSRNDPKYTAGWEYLTYLTGRLFMVRGENELALHYARKGIEIYKSDPFLVRYLAKSYELDNQLDKALVAYKDAIKKKPGDLWMLAELGGVYAKQGNVVEARKVIAQMEKMRKPFDYGAIEYNQGRTYALMGETNEAVRLLEASIAKGQKLDLWITFEHDPDLLVLKDDPGYKAMMAKFK